MNTSTLAIRVVVDNTLLYVKVTPLLFTDGYFHLQQKEVIMLAKGTPRLIVALDGMDRDKAIDLAKLLASIPGVWGMKVNSLLRAVGYDLIKDLSFTNVMADLKPHDIPETLGNDGKLMRNWCPPNLATVHGSGGRKMVKAFVDGLNGASRVLGITLLTSLDEDDCERIYGTRDKDAVVMRLAREAIEGGADGLVSSAKEVAMLRQAFPEALLVTPGIRPTGADAGDQKRVSTPFAAITAGSDLLVVGRPITEAADPVDAAKDIIAENYSAEATLG